MFTMPLLCLVFEVCPYGVDPLLWLTHFLKLLTTCVISSYADWSLELSAAAVYGQTAARVLFWVNCKAVFNTIMVYTGWKRPGAFKVCTWPGMATWLAAAALVDAVMHIPRCRTLPGASCLRSDASMQAHEPMTSVAVCCALCNLLRHVLRKQVCTQHAGDKQGYWPAQASRRRRAHA